MAIEHTTEVTVFTINTKCLDICSANDEMPYSGKLNTIQKEMPQLLL